MVKVERRFFNGEEEFNLEYGLVKEAEIKDTNALLLKIMCSGRQKMISSSNSLPSAEKNRTCVPKGEMLFMIMTARVLILSVLDGDKALPFCESYFF